MPGREVREYYAAPRGRVRGYRVEDVPFRDMVAAMVNRRPPFDPARFRRHDPGYDPVMLPPRRWTPTTTFKPNLILREWGAIVGRLLLRQGLQYGISGMYVEFANNGSPVAIPSYDRETDSGVAYYNSLADDAERDYLRVQLISGVLGSSDAAVYPNGNEPTFFAMTSGVTGVHGKAFSDAADSRVVGAALVAMPDETDATQDLVLSRFYFDPEDQIPKLPTGQVGIEWAVALQ
jgi:hypothetical protein